MMQDFVIQLAYIGYALAVLMGMGTILTWVERKQGAVMSDRIAPTVPTCASRSPRSS